MIFNFVLKYLIWLKDVPLLPQILEAYLLLVSKVFNPEILKCIDEIEDQITQWEGVTISNHKYGGIQFDYLGKEIGHIHGNGLLDILLTKSIKNDLILSGKALGHHTLMQTGWITFPIKSTKDKNNALELLQISKELKQKTHV